MANRVRPPSTLVADRMPALGERVLVPQAGYPNGSFAGGGGNFDPAMGRGYRTGDSVVLQAGESRQVHSHGMVSGFFRWKVRIAVTAPPRTTLVAGTAYYVDATVCGKNENDAIEQKVDVGLGNAQVCYTTGRSLTINVTNPSSIPLVVAYSLDEATPGLSNWTWTEQIASSSAETELSIPPFAQSMQTLSLETGPSWVFRGYDRSGAQVFRATMGAGRGFPHIPVDPTLTYTVQPTVGAAPVHVLYQCIG